MPVLLPPSIPSRCVLRLHPSSGRTATPPVIVSVQLDTINASEEEERGVVIEIGNGTYSTAPENSWP